MGEDVAHFGEGLAMMPPLSWDRIGARERRESRGSEGGAASRRRDRRAQHRDDSRVSGWGRVPGRSEDKLLDLLVVGLTDGERDPARRCGATRAKRLPGPSAKVARRARESRHSGPIFPLSRHGPAGSNPTAGNADRAAL